MHSFTKQQVKLVYFEQQLEKWPTNSLKSVPTKLATLYHCKLVTNVVCVCVCVSFIVSQRVYLVWPRVFEINYSYIVLLMSMFLFRYSFSCLKGTSIFPFLLFLCASIDELNSAFHCSFHFLFTSLDAILLSIIFASLFLFLSACLYLFRLTINRQFEHFVTC